MHAFFEGCRILRAVSAGLADRSSSAMPMYSIPERRCAAVAQRDGESGGSLQEPPRILDTGNLRAWVPSISGDAKDTIGGIQ